MPAKPSVPLPVKQLPRTGEPDQPFDTGWLVLSLLGLGAIGLGWRLRR